MLVILEQADPETALNIIVSTYYVSLPNNPRDINYIIDIGVCCRKSLSEIFQSLPLLTLLLQLSLSEVFEL